MGKYVSSLLLVLGLCLLLYSPLCSCLNSRSQAGTLLSYQKAVARLDAASRQTRLTAAEQKNDSAALTAEESGIIAYVTIPALQAALPVFAGTSEELLRKGIGLLEGTSLPLGGVGRHSVLCGHRGLPEARLFRDLDRLVLGDVFTVTVLDRQQHYHVDQILIIEPDETDALLPVAGEDLCTLLTCTPYGINSHRLLVRGRRVPEPSA